MSKKRLRGNPAWSSVRLPAGSKHDAQYWRGRLFRCRYTYKGEQRKVRNWSVKIQHLGKRRTFILRSSRRSEAAAEACGLYRILVTQGWRGLASQASWRPAQRHPRASDPASIAAEKLAADYWAQRLIHREYTMSLRLAAHQELSVRMDYEGAYHYLPLGTNNPRMAARRAARIYRSLVSQGWAAANQRFSRELTVAFHWLDVPLAWTYTTIHTLNPAAQAPPGEPLQQASTRVRAAVVESDGGIRRALEWCVNQMDGLCCVAAFASAEEALRDLRRTPIQFALVGQNLSDKSGTACLEEMKATAPEVAGLLYSVYEDSEELFRRTPGGAGTYLLRRTGPTAFLEPIHAWLKRGPLAGERMTSAAWQYFKDSVDSMPVGGSALQLASLTQREQEVLGLLSKGHLDKEIADQLGISIYTVHEHVRNIFDKLGAHNRTEAAVKFLQK